MLSNIARQAFNNKTTSVCHNIVEHLRAGLGRGAAIGQRGSHLSRRAWCDLDGADPKHPAARAHLRRNQQARSRDLARERKMPASWRCRQVGEYTNRYSVGSDDITSPSAGLQFGQNPCVPVPAAGIPPELPQGNHRVLMSPFDAPGRRRTHDGIKHVRDKLDIRRLPSQKLPYRKADS